MNKLIAILFTSCSFLFVAQAAPVPTLQTIPATGAAAGQPGSILGFGLTLNYSATGDWVLLNDSFFTGSQLYLNYKDYVANEFIVAGPNPESSTVPVAFSLGTTGLGEFDIDTFAPSGTVVTGNITVDYDIFSQDPNSPTFDPGSFVSAGQASAPVTLSITPEPETLGLMLAGLALFGTWRVRRACAVAHSNR